jgi:hypothetical protein
MADLTECKSCGYKLRKNSNRTIKEVVIKMNTIEDDKWINFFFMKNIILCNICLMTLKNYIEDFFAGEIQ